MDQQKFVLEILELRKSIILFDLPTFKKWLKFIGYLPNQL